MSNDPLLELELVEMKVSAFPSGVVIFFRIMTPDAQLARGVHLEGRSVLIGASDYHHNDYVVVDEKGAFLACYPREFVAAIMPLKTEGEPDASYKSR
jgi:hypothetical protein